MTPDRQADTQRAPEHRESDRTPTARGRYDRAKTTAERRQEQIDRLVLAAASLVENGPRRLTVDNVTRRARVGRNTFYLAFHDVADLILHMESELVGAFWLTASTALQTAYTPIEKLRALASAWLRALATHRPQARVALCMRDSEAAPPTSLRNAIGRLVAAAQASAYRDGILGTQADPLRLVACVAIMEALGRRYLQEGGDAGALEAALSDLLLRVLR